MTSADRSRANTLGINATPEQRTKVEISRTGLHWEDIDEDISVAGLIAGRAMMDEAGRSRREQARPASVAPRGRDVGLVRAWTYRAAPFHVFPS